MSEDYGISNDGGFRLSHMVQAQRGLSDREIEIFLATGQKPDLSQPPPEELERIDGDTQIMPLNDAAAWLSGGTLTASSFFDFDSSHSVSPLYEVVRPKVEALKFDPRQPRDGDGKWTDGFPGVNPPDITSKPSGIKTGGSAKSTKKVTPAVIYKKHDDGAVVGHSASGQRMRWDAGRKKFIVEKEKSGSWVEESAHTKSSAYNEMKNPDKWFEPAEIGTENEPSSPSLTPEPDLADTDTTAESVIDTGPEVTDVTTPTVDVAPSDQSSYDDRVKAAATGQDALKSAPISDRKSLDKMTTTESPMWAGSDIMVESDTDVNGVPGGKVRDAIADYRDNGYQHVNYALRTAEGDLDSIPDKHPTLGHQYSAKRVNDQITGLDAAMKSSQLDQDVMVHRGVTDPVKTFGDAWPGDGDAIGMEWTDHAYASTSVDKDATTKFAGYGAGVRMNILVPKGTSAIGVENTGALAGEKEILLDRGLRYRVVADREENGVRTLDVEALRDTAPITSPDLADTDTTAPQHDVTPEIPKQADAPEIESTLTTPYVGPSITDYADLPPDIADRVRQAHLAEVLHAQRIDDRATELRKADPDKYTGWDAYDRSMNDARAELDGQAPDSVEYDAAMDALNTAFPGDWQTADKIRRRLGIEAINEKMLMIFAEKNNLGPVTPELKADLARRTKEAFTGKKVAVRVSAKTVEHILGAGRIKSQFETNKSSGKKDVDMRASVEKMLFGIDDKPWQNTEKRPIYGYVALDGIRPAGVGSAQLGDPSTDALTQYGNVQVVLKDSVRNRTTAMFGDSLNNMQEGVPSPIDNPDWKSFMASRGGITGKGLEGLDRSGEGQDFRAGAYAEAQIHGGVGVEDIEEIVFPTNPTTTVRDQLDKTGIPYRVLNFKTAADGSDEERATALRIAEEDKPFIEAEIAKIKDKIANLKSKTDESYYLKDLAKYEKQLKAINDALPALRGEKKSTKSKVTAAKENVATAIATR